MNVNSASEILNSAAKQVMADAPVAALDLSNAVDFGRTVLDTVGFNTFYSALVDQFADIRFIADVLPDWAPSLYKKPYEFGAIHAMYRSKMRDATPDPMWDLQDGQSVDPFIVTKYDVYGRFWSSKNQSVVNGATVQEDVLKSAFRSANELAAFLGMLEMQAINSHKRDLNNSAMFAVQAAVGNCQSSDKTQLINLLSEYNTAFTKSLKAANALMDSEFLRYSIYRIGQICDFMTQPTSMFNNGGFDLWTPKESQKAIILSDYARAVGVYLHDAPGQFNIGNLSVASGDVVSAWQGFGTTGSFADRSSIKNTVTIGGNSVTTNVTGLVGLVYDNEAIAVTGEHSKITTHYNGRGDYLNTFYHLDIGMLVNPDMPMVAFVVAD